VQDTEYYNLAAMEYTHWWHVGMADIAADLLRQLPHESNKWILDAGCGTGRALRWLTEFGRVCGLDRHPLAMQFAGRHGNRQLVQADVAALPFRDESVAILTAFDVLYHRDVADDQAALQEFARVLRPGGWLVLRLPAYDWLRGAHDAVVHTRHRYTRWEVRRKLVGAGFEPTRVTYANTLLLGPAILWRSLQRRGGRGPASDVRQSPAWVSLALRTVLHVERLWLRLFNLPVGLSVLAVAQKAGA